MRRYIFVAAVELRRILFMATMRTIVFMVVAFVAGYIAYRLRLGI